ncbi:hypothetical protein [Methylotenera sp.]|uniref:hypothetical protein n=1 Tax=Methylotenera sp. TaxID=2051956 RepID=UPI002716ACBF|nr:hypothetical protein [Methylotenera sp.]MDO9204135.1 hypothetical protein [Methylotenera sp.]MDP2071737.1 hypothetical protein [Methylotenera sp.]MDP3006057.1 hypothetical protein [Methylotenera sp.]
MAEPYNYPMKNPHKERLYLRMRQYHRHHQWPVGGSGLFIPHAYPKLLNLSWWDDVGFILNGRRIMVWWMHPRMKYTDAINDLAWQEAGDPPLHGADLFERSEKQWKKVGRSRKKVISYVTRQTPDAQWAYYDKLNSIEMRMQSEGIDSVISPSLSVEILPWCRGISLCAPIEVRDKKALSDLAALAKRLIKGETTLIKEFPKYQYGREDWQLEADLRIKDREARDEGV